MIKVLIYRKSNTSFVRFVCLSSKQEQKYRPVCVCVFLSHDKMQQNAFLGKAYRRQMCFVFNVIVISKLHNMHICSAIIREQYFRYAV